MSKYSSLLQAKQGQSPISEESNIEAEQSIQAPLPASAPSNEPVQAVTEHVTEVPPAPIVAATAKLLNMEPPRGKKGHPDYNQVTIYLKKHTQNRAKIAMLQAQEERDFSELVEDLLTDWLATNMSS
jgi:hypothetical protein